MASEDFARCGCGLSVIALTLVMTQATAADPSAADRDKARRLMDDGHALVDGGDHAGALQNFMNADEIMHVPTTSLAVAREQIATGKLVEAKATLISLVRMPIKAREPEPFTRARSEAQTLLAELGPRVPILEITVVSGKDVVPELLLDSAILPPSSRTRPIEVNPGRHVVVAAAGSARAAAEFEAVEGETRSVTLTLKSRPMPAADTSATRPTSAGEVPATPLQTYRPYLFWGGASLAGVGILAGTVTGILSLSAANAAKQGCVDNRCPPSTWSDLDRARTTATVANVSLALAGVGAVVASLSVFLPNPPGPSAAATGAATVPRVEPWLGVGSVGVRGGF